MSKKLDGKVAVVTGGNSGIGLATARRFSHGGLNTALESLARGVPMVVLPVAYDQPGVGARVEWSGVGRSIPVGRLTVDRLRDAVRTVLGDPVYRERAGQLRTSIEAADGLNRAAAAGLPGASRGVRSGTYSP
jgi:NAD(P)-dependent dehydrogenase (short-subunit alcohol dehydrogenase family)